MGVDNISEESMNMVRWKKIGLIFDPTNMYEWMKTHAQLPTAISLSDLGYSGCKDSMYRVYFASRDDMQRSQVGYIDIDLENPFEILDVSTKPVLTYGDIGFFDEHGVYASSVIELNGKIYMYYIGWNKGAEPPLFYASIGLAVSEDRGKTFTKYSKAPIMSRSEYDPCLVTSPFVLKDKGVLRMYYVSGIKWERHEDGKLKSFYHIKYAESKDGVNWERNGVVAVDFLTAEERDISRACVFRESGIYKAVFGTNTVDRPYRIYYAESQNGIRFIRTPMPIEIYPRRDGDFDSQMQSYPFVIIHKGDKFILYNGNNFGKEGIGLAIEE